MTTPPTVAELWRYPVKSLQGEEVEHLTVGSQNVAGDRRYALRNAVDGTVLSAKRVPALFAGSARWVDDEVVLGIPGHGDIAATDERVHEAVSAWLDRPVRVTPVPEGELDLGRDSIWPEVGAFVDLSAVHLLTTASLETMAGLEPAGDWDVRRFRPTALVAGAAAGYPEEEWIGQQVVIGGVTIEVELACERCGMVTQPQPALGSRPPLVRDKAVYRIVREQHSTNLGVYARVVEPGEIRVGDPLTVPPGPRA